MSRVLTGVRADHKYSYQKLESFAAQVRTDLKFAPDEAIDPLRLFEDLHKLYVDRGHRPAVRLGYGVVDLEDSEGYARYDRNKQVIEVLASHTTYERLRKKHPRASYFVAHEVAHCVLHTEQLIRLAQMPTSQQQAFHRGRHDHKPFEDTEWQANAFAGALLMPARGIVLLEQEYGYLDQALIVERFRVSNEAAGYRLGTFNQRKDELLR